MNIVGKIVSSIGLIAIGAGGYAFLQSDASEQAHIRSGSEVVTNSLHSTPSKRSNLFDISNNSSYYENTSAKISGFSRRVVGVISPSEVMEQLAKAPRSYAGASEFYPVCLGFDQDNKIRAIQTNKGELVQFLKLNGKIFMLADSTSPSKEEKSVSSLSFFPLFGNSAKINVSSEAMPMFSTVVFNIRKGGIDGIIDTPSVHYRDIMLSAHIPKSGTITETVELRYECKKIQHGTNTVVEEEF